VPVTAVRIDKWLWAARFFKTRTAATDAVTGGRVHVNGARVKPSRDVFPGDTVEVRVGHQQWTVIVRGLSEKRGSASIAATLYEETPESAALREQRALEARMSRPLGADLGMRPTKQDRRRIESLRRTNREGR
jgi:ribosome-associated heat shock protein Hsp15